MQTHDADIFISGGGIAGQVAAAVFAARGFSVVLADPVPPVTEADLDGSDLRSTAFLRPARSLFEACGLWPLLEPHSKPLDSLAVIDTTGWPPEVRDRRTFAATDMGDEPFGWNLMNWVVRRELWAYLQNAERITALYGTGFKSLVNRDAEVIVGLTSGDRVRAKLAIAADGKFSPLREALSAFVDSTQENVTGTVRVKLYKGNCNSVGIKSDFSLYSEEFATFGVDEVYNQKDAEGFINLFGLPLKVKALMDEKRK